MIRRDKALAHASCGALTLEERRSENAARPNIRLTDDPATSARDRYHSKCYKNRLMPNKRGFNYNTARG